MSKQHNISVIFVIPLVKIRLLLHWSCWIFMASSQALHPHAFVCTISSELLYGHGFHFHPTYPSYVCLLCLSTKYMWGTKEVTGRGEREWGAEWTVDTSDAVLLLIFVGCKTTFNQGWLISQCTLWGWAVYSVGSWTSISGANPQAGDAV